MLRTHKIKLNPTPDQAAYFAQCAGIARYVYNWTLAEYRATKARGEKANYNLLKKRLRIAALTDDELAVAESEQETEGQTERRQTQIAEARALAQAEIERRAVLAPDVRRDHSFIGEVASCVIDEAVADVSRAINVYYRAQKTYRDSGNVKAAARLKFPSWRKRREGQAGFAYTNTRFTTDGHDLHLSRCPGAVDMAEPLHFNGKAMSCRITQSGGIWYASIVTEVESPHRERPTWRELPSGQRVPSARSEKPASEKKGVIGVHFGLRVAVTTSDGEQIEPPKFFSKGEDKLAKLQRALSRKQKGSARYRKMARRVAKAHAHVANQRAHFQHNVTTVLIRENETVVYDKWDVQELIDLSAQEIFGAGAFYDAGVATMADMLEYKGLLYDTEVVAARLKASKTCHKCGTINEQVTLVQKVWQCVNCQEIHDREMNAAMNNYSLGCNHVET